MSAKVILKITKGEAQGKSYEFEEVSRVLIGRQADCAIIIPEKTVSRYHCLLEITPPKVLLQDFGSLNGTFLNGEKIGQRDRDQSWEDARDQKHEAFELKDGDVLGLGRQCEIRCVIETKETCPLCGAVLPEAPADMMATMLDSAVLPEIRLDEQGRRICEDCWKKQQKPVQPEAPQNEAPESPAAESPAVEPPEAEEKKCTGCGKSFKPSAPDNNLCPSCLADQARVLDAVLAMMNIKKQSGKKEEKAQGPSIVSGYDKVSLLGKGGMGEVWKVRSRANGKEFALKTMLPEIGMDENAKNLFLREADICKCLDHKNVVKAYETGSANGILYILMDLCEGGSVDDLIEKNGGKLSLELGTYIMLQVLSGLDYVHNMDINVLVKAGLFRGMKEVSTNGVVHRDFKPGNIFLVDKSDHPVAKVADFGMAKAFNAAGRSQVSKTGTVKGTPVFMPKQQAMNCKYAKPEVDVWAAAASYYHMLTGEFVKNFRPGVNIWQVIIMEPAVPIRQRDASIPREMAAVIDKALVEEPAIGYSSAAALRRDLVKALPASVRDFCRDIL